MPYNPVATFVASIRILVDDELGSEENFGRPIEDLDSRTLYLNAAKPAAWSALSALVDSIVIVQAALSDSNSALSPKAALASPTFTGTVGGITKAMVGLGNVDNTSDLSKPISSLTQAALDLKAAASHSHSVATTGADGFMSSTDKTKLDTIEANAKAAQTGAEFAGIIDTELGGTGWRTGETGALTWVVITTSTLASPGFGYIIDASGGPVALTLPPAAPGDLVGISVKNAANEIRVLSSLINGATGYAILATNDYLVLSYTTTYGWDSLNFALSVTPMSGYASGGYSTANSNVINAFAFGSAVNATDYGNLTVARYNVAGQSSSSDGYASSGLTGAYQNVIDFFSFGSAVNAVDFGNLTALKSSGTGQSSDIAGYYSGGFNSTYYDVIDSFNFGSAVNATDFGDLFQARNYPSGQNSSSDGYTSGGYTGAVASNVIDYFAFGSAVNAADFANLATGGSSGSGQSSASDGYSSCTSLGINNINKFAFGSLVNAANFGTLTQGRAGSSGQSSPTNGYVSGGIPSGNTNAIDTFIFGSNTTATDFGDLTVAARYLSGQQG
jgi:hypothetical protein